MLAHQAEHLRRPLVAVLDGLDARENRTQGQNREAARERLVALIEQASRRPKKRRPTRPGAAAKERRLTSKKKRSDVKAGRAKAGDD